MPHFGTKSKRELATCDIRLQEIAHIAIKTVDFAVIEGHRGKEKQNQAFNAGKSEIEWPNGKHNSDPSKAFDLFPSPYDWKDREAFIRFAAFILGIAAGLGYKLRWGGDWDKDWDLKDNRFNDWPHFEIIGD